MYSKSQILITHAQIFITKNSLTWPNLSLAPILTPQNCLPVDIERYAFCPNQYLFVTPSLLFHFDQIWFNFLSFLFPPVSIFVLAPFFSQITFCERNFFPRFFVAENLSVVRTVISVLDAEQNSAVLQDRDWVRGRAGPQRYETFFTPAMIRWRNKLECLSLVFSG